jgi:hypothetical protein
MSEYIIPYIKTKLPYVTFILRNRKAVFPFEADLMPLFAQAPLRFRSYKSEEQKIREEIERERERNRPRVFFRRLETAVVGSAGERSRREA